MDLLPKRKESGPLERFKNQNAVLKQFGEPGYLLYNAIDGAKTLTVLQNELAIDEAKLVEMLEYMQGRGMIAIDEIDEAVPEADIEPPVEPRPKRPGAQIAAEPEEEAAGEPEPAPAQEEEESPAPESVPQEEPASETPEEPVEEKEDENPFATSAPGRIAPIGEEESSSKKKKTPKPPLVPRGVLEDLKTSRP